MCCSTSESTQVTSIDTKHEIEMATENTPLLAKKDTKKKANGSEPSEGCSSSSSSNNTSSTVVNVNEPVSAHHARSPDCAHGLSRPHSFHNHCRSAAELCEDAPYGHVHFSNRVGWLRAAVLGANDGLLSISSLLSGVSAGSTARGMLVLSGVAALVAGAFSMACGEYVSVASQMDTEAADMLREKQEFLKGPEHMQRELEELAQIYQSRGLSEELAMTVAKELHDSAQGNLDVLTKIHLREELNVDIDDLSNPLEAAVVSALCFSIGGIFPLLPAIFVNDSFIRIIVIYAISIAGFIANGALGAYMGGASMLKGSLRVLLGGCLALALSFAVGHFLKIDI